MKLIDFKDIKRNQILLIDVAQEEGRRTHCVGFYRPENDKENSVALAIAISDPERNLFPPTYALGVCRIELKDIIAIYLLSDEYQERPQDIDMSVDFRESKKND